MLKWKRDYLLKKKLNNNNSYKSDKGFTLVELLASLAILSVVILLAGSVHIFGQRQFISQTESASQANDMSYALSVMSRDLRKEAFDDVTLGENTIEVLDGPTFEVRDQILYKNDEIISGSVSMDSPQLNKEEKSLKIVLKSSSGNSQNKTYQTTIYFRR